MIAQQTLAPPPARSSAHGMALPPAFTPDDRPSDRPATGPWAAPSSAGFVEMLIAFRDTGGTARGDDLAGLLQAHQRGDFVSLARHIAAREIFGFTWRHTFWTPMFQFDLRNLRIRPQPQKVLALLATTYDGWGMACWFAQRHPLLGDRRPVDLLGTELPALLATAEADRSAEVR